MTETNVLFVIGAGASFEVDIPIGDVLVKELAKTVDFSVSQFGEVNQGDKEIVAALSHQVRNLDGARGDINQYLQAGRRIASAMPQAISIDNFLHAHQGNTAIELVGKLGIVRSILAAEAKSKLRFQDTFVKTIRFDRLDNTWFKPLYQRLSEGRRVADLPSLLHDAAFIIFNYDRCVEHFLFYALQNYFGVEEWDAVKALNNIRFIHPYGTVGHLPWQERNGSIDFGADCHPVQLLDAAKKIRTFTESVGDQGLLMEMKDVLHQARKIVFLGFAYHDQNLSLMNLNQKSPHKQVLGTAHGISEPDKLVIEQKVKKLFYAGGHCADVSIDHQRRCFEFFKDNQQFLSLS